MVHLQWQMPVFVKFLDGIVKIDSYKIKVIPSVAEYIPALIERMYKLIFNLRYTGTGTKFGAYLSPSPTLFMHKINIYWPIMKSKLTNNEYSWYST